MVQIAVFGRNQKTEPSKVLLNLKLFDYHNNLAIQTSIFSSS